MRAQNIRDFDFGTDKKIAHFSNTAGDQTQKFFKVMSKTLKPTLKQRELIERSQDLVSVMPTVKISDKLSWCFLANAISKEAG